MRALDLNLATRPFQNNTPFWVGHALLLLLVTAFAACNARTYVVTGRNLKALQADIGSVAAQMAELDKRNEEAVRLARTFDLKILQAQADKANDIILRRGLSWTRLFNQLEEVMPYEVRATSIRPIYGTREATARGPSFEGTVPIVVEGDAQSLEAFLEFERALIMDPHYSGVEPVRTESIAGQNDLKFELRFLYDPEGRLGGEHPEIPHILDAARRAAEEGGEAPPSALQDLP
jgi:Tfp pilus assembly protein PilN